MVALWSSWYSMLMKTQISGGYCVDMFGLEAGKLSKLGTVVKVLDSHVEDPGFNSRWRHKIGHHSWR